MADTVTVTGREMQTLMDLLREARMYVRDNRDYEAAVRRPTVLQDGLLLRLDDALRQHGQDIFGNY